MRVNDEPVKAATKVKVGDVVRYRVQGWDRILEVKQLLLKRVGAPVAREAYTDLTLPRPKVCVPIATREPGAGRPTKRERRELDRLFGRDSNYGRMR